MSKKFILEIFDRYRQLALSSSLALTATIFFVISDATIKYAVMKDIQFYHFLFYGTPAYLIVPLYLLFTGQLVKRLMSRNYFIPILRGIIFLPTPFLVFLSLEFVSLPEFTTLTMTAPLFSLIFSIFLLKERINIYIFYSIFLGLSGVILVIKPGFSTFNPFFLLVLLNAFLISVASLIVNKFNTVVSSEGYFIYGGFFVHFFSIIFFLFDPLFLDLFTTCLVVLASVFVNFAMLFLVIAFRTAQKFYGSISCLNYLQILWSVIIGSIIFDQVFNTSTAIGALLIVGSGILSVIAQAKQVDSVT